MRILPCTPPWLGLALSLTLSLAARSGYADELKDRILSLRERADITNQILEDRLDTVVPQVMRAAGIDAWVLIAREYNEDPIVKTMLPATWLNARRRTVLMFIDQGPELGIARMAVARYPVGDLFPGVWNPEQQPDQYERIAQILDEADPDRIALNYSDVYALADGLTYSEQRDFLQALPLRLRDRVVSSEAVAVGCAFDDAALEATGAERVAGVWTGILHRVDSLAPSVECDRQIADPSGQHRAVLNVALLSDDDLVGVAPNHRVEPHAALVFEHDGSDHVCRGRDVGLAFDAHAPIAELVDHQSALPLNSTGE